MGATMTPVGQTTEATVTKTARQLKKGDVLIARDGRGNERVLFNIQGARGFRFVRTSRYDHHFANAAKVEVVK